MLYPFTGEKPERQVSFNASLVFTPFVDSTVVYTTWVTYRSYVYVTVFVSRKYQANKFTPSKTVRQVGDMVAAHQMCDR